MAAKNLENVDLLMDAVQALARSQLVLLPHYCNHFTSDHILKYLKVLEGRIFSDADASSGSLRKQLAMSPTLVLIT